MDPATGAVQTFCGGLREPEALTAAGDSLILADTSAHRIVRVHADGSSSLLLG